MPLNHHKTPGRYCDLKGIPEESDLQVGMDFRLPQYRREAFLRFYEWSCKWRCHPGGVYFILPFLRKCLSWTREQGLWFAFLNGHTEHPITSWLMYKRFPDFHAVATDDTKYNALVDWFGLEKTRLRWDDDRWKQKRDFLKAVKVYADLTKGNQEQFFDSFVNTTDPYENFRNAWQVVVKGSKTQPKFHSFGRMSSFGYLEYLRILRLNIDCDNLFLEEDGSHSHRDGLAVVLGRDDLCHKFNPDVTYTPEVLAWMKKEASLLLDEAKSRGVGKPYAHDISYFTLESAFCTYKSWHLPDRRYPGVYLDMNHDRIRDTQAKWPEEDLSMFWAARHECLPKFLRLEDNPGDPGLKPEKQNHYRLTGQILGLQNDWPCFENDFNKEVEERNEIS
jgi:hypothetical protein